MARQHDLAIDPPNAPKGEAGNAVTTKELSRSGGVIEPPPVNDPAVIKPPKGVRYGMPTVPDNVAPSPPSTPAPSTPLGAEKRALLESILVAARAEARRGNEKACFERMQKAQDLLGGAPTR